MNSLHLHQILINTNYLWVYMGNWITCCVRARDQVAGIPNAGTLTFPTSTGGTDCSHPLPVPTVSNQNSSRKKRTGIVPSPRSESEILSSPYLRALLLSELAKATTNFHSDCLLGEGGFGYVYKGWLCNDTLTAATPGSGLGVAVKKLKPRGLQGHKEWLSEVNYLGQLRHPNLVKLIGFCLEGENRLLVYEFMPRGSLENHLFPKSAPVLPWATRIKVAIAAARGLLFLHDAEPQVIYRDFKASNILLDSEFNAKLSDFGLAKSGPTGDHSHVSTQVMGTQGYTAPEYLATGKLTAKCDVYSFGVVLLELLTGRHVMDKRKAGAEQNLIEWATPYLHDKKKLFRIMDTKLEGQYPRKAATIAATLALHCVHPESRGRPDMSFVLSALEQLPSKYMSGRPFGDRKKMSKSRHKSESAFPGSVRTKHASRISEGTKSPRER